MAGSMAVSLDDIARERPRTRSPSRAGLVHLQDPIRLRVNRHHPAASGAVELLDAAGVIMMMMGHQVSVSHQPVVPAPPRRRPSLQHVDGGGRAAFGIMEEKRRKLSLRHRASGLGGHGVSLRWCGDGLGWNGSSVMRRAQALQGSRLQGRAVGSRQPCGLIVGLGQALHRTVGGRSVLFSRHVARCDRSAQFLRPAPGRR